jgi:hypothetical protein
MSNDNTDTDTQFDNNNTGHATDPAKSSGASPPGVAPAASALTGIPLLDACVRDYRMVPKVLVDLRNGRVRGTVESLLQARSLLVGRDENAMAIALIDASLQGCGADIDAVKSEMPWAIARRTVVGAYVEAGERCYEVSPALAECLSATELRGVTGDSLRLPFDSIAIVVPEEMQDLAQVVFVSILPADKVRNVFTGELWKTPVLSVVAFARAGANVDTFAINPRLDEGDIRDALAEALKGYRNDDHSTSLDDAKARTTRLFWWAVNACLYITHAGAESEARHPSSEAEHKWQLLNAEPGPKRRQRLLSLYNSKFRQRIYLGRSVEPLGIRTRGPIGARTLVAGHWRNQVFGAGRQNRRLTWIEPFWRGPRSAPVSNPIRVLNETRRRVGPNLEHRDDLMVAGA